ncbi:MAG: hypothetical protein U0169_25210 [Polyangiaceae bacterium]
MRTFRRLLIVPFLAGITACVATTAPDVDTKVDDAGADVREAGGRSGDASADTSVADTGATDAKVDGTVQDATSGDGGAADVAADSKTDGDACSAVGDLSEKCPTGCVQYTPGGEDGGIDYDAASGRFICGDFVMLLRACMAKHFPGVQTWFVRGECIRDGHVRARHDITVYLDPCTGQLCAVEPQSQIPGASPAPCCWTPPPGQPPSPLSMPNSCTGFGGDIFDSGTGANVFLCEPPDQLGQVDIAESDGGYCDYGPGNEFWHCEDTLCRVCSEFGTDPTPLFDAGTVDANVTDATPEDATSPDASDGGADATDGDVVITKDAGRGDAGDAGVRTDDASGPGVPTPP